AAAPLRVHPALEEGPDHPGIPGMDHDRAEGTDVPVLAETTQGVSLRILPFPGEVLPGLLQRGAVRGVVRSLEAPEEFVQPLGVLELQGAPVQAAPGRWQR